MGTGEKPPPGQTVKFAQEKNPEKEKRKKAISTQRGKSKHTDQHRREKNQRYLKR